MKCIIQGWKGQYQNQKSDLKKGEQAVTVIAPELWNGSAHKHQFPFFLLYLHTSPAWWGDSSDTASAKPYLCSSSQSMPHWRVAWDSVSFGLFPATVGLCHFFHFLNSAGLSLSRSSQSLHLAGKKSKQFMDVLHTHLYYLIQSALDFTVTVGANTIVTLRASVFSVCSTAVGNT